MNTSKGETDLMWLKIDKRFWTFLISPLVAGLTLGWIIAFVNGIECDFFSRDGWAIFFDLLGKELKPAVYVAALFLPSITIYFTACRFSQAQEQLHELKIQNSLANFYNHKEMFINNLEIDLLPEHLKKIITKRVLDKFYENTYENHSVKHVDFKCNTDWVSKYYYDLIYMVHFLDACRVNSEDYVRYRLYLEFFEKEVKLRRNLTTPPLSLSPGEVKKGIIPKPGITTKLVNENSKETEFTSEPNQLFNLWERVKSYLQLLDTLKTPENSQNSRYSDKTMGALYNCDAYRDLFGAYSSPLIYQDNDLILNSEVRLLITEDKRKRYRDTEVLVLKKIDGTINSCY